MLIATWWEDYRGWVEEQAAQQGLSDADATAFRAHVAHLVEGKAWMAAQQQALGRAGHVVFSGRDLQTALDRTISQRPRPLADGSLPGTPRHVHRSMRERLASVGIEAGPEEASPA